MKCNCCGKTLIKRFLNEKVVEQCIGCNYYKEHVNFKQENIERYLKAKAKGNVNIIISKLKKYRLDNSYSQPDISKFLNMTAQRYGAIERCENDTSISQLVEIADVYNVTLNDIIQFKSITKEEYDSLQNFVIDSEDDGTGRVPIIKFNPEIKEYRDKLIEIENDIKNNINKSEIEKLQLEYKSLKEKLNKYKKSNGALLLTKNLIEYYRYEAFIKQYKEKHK